MRCLPHVMVFFLIATSGFAEEAVNKQGLKANRNNTQQLRGYWQLLERYRDSKKQPIRNEDADLRITGRRSLWGGLEWGDGLVYGRYEIDPENKKGYIDFRVYVIDVDQDHEKLDATYRGLYLLQGDKLLIGFGKENGARPTTLSKKASHEFSVYKRVTKQRRDQNADLRMEVMELLDAAGSAHNKAWATVVAEALTNRLEEIGITDQIEVEFLASVNRLLEVKDAKTVLSVFLLKPGDDVSRVRRITFGRRMTYTCMKARVVVPVAIVNIINVEGEEVSVRQMFLRYTTKTGWKRIAE